MPAVLFVRAACSPPAGVNWVPCATLTAATCQGACHSPCVLVAQAAITKYCRLGGLNDRNLFSHTSGGWKSQIRVPAWLSSGEDPLSGLQTATFLLCSHVASTQSLLMERE